MRIVFSTFRILMICVFTSLGLCVANAQQDRPEAPAPKPEVAGTPDLAQEAHSPVADHRAPSSNGLARSRDFTAHSFWDRENLALFALVAGSRALDYSSTLNMRRRGRQEVFLTNDIVDNHPAFAAIEAGGTAVSLGASYLFHRYHHHRLERWTSIVHASLATSGAVRNYCLKTAHPPATP